ncbi:MAG TPA: hypothetical protein DF715_11030 [Oceanicaulis sp.]|jgi:hypothetical protein|uniref:Uncharacterized protein n=1 Tax=Glycocaulis albus TaxID=1382801 RepID=A0ABQ1XNV1_9PROT|nr:hypothetical protein [Glycocaulis albus]GGG99030.1 hypothetical protein GCM10007420_13590 [Glycocaulis albus]HCY56029.1 hypothetical protein [Oceanicaulis sp.]
MKRLFASGAALVASLAAGAPAFADCFAIPGTAGAQPTVIQGFNVREAAARPGPLQLPPLPEGTGAILCDRESVVPDRNDFKVLLAGLPLMIRAGTPEDPTVVSMGIQDGDYAIGVMMGSLTDEERQGIISTVEGFDDSIDEMERWMEENPQ